MDNRPVLAERHAELAALAQLVGEGGTVVVEGPAGVGKSTLLAAAHELGADAGRAVLSVRATRLERAFAFGAAEQLLGMGAPAADDGGLTGIRQLAEVVLDRAATTDLLLIVDDAQWSDPESLRLLVYLARRLTGRALALAIGVRTGEPDAPRELLAALTEAATVVVRPRSLSEGAATALVADWARGVAPALQATCVRTAAGNPLYLRELSRAAADGRDLISGAVTGLAADVEQRIAAAGDGAERVARAVAVLGDGVTLGAVATLAGLDPVAAGAAATALQRSEILAGSGTYRFTHPLLRAAIEDAIDDGTALTLRRAAADLLEREGASAERVAAQVLAAPPAGDPTAVRRLLDAAAVALAHGAPASAAALLERALIEPPPPNRRADVQLALARAERRLGRRSAVEHLQAALAAAGTPQDRATCALELAVAFSHLGNYLRSGRVLQAAMRTTPTAELEVNLAAAAFLDTRVAHVPGALRSPDAPAAELVEAMREPEVSAVRLAAALEASAPSADFVDLHSTALFTLIGLEAHAAARALIDRQLAGGLAQGWARGLWILLVSRARLEHTAGELTAAADTLGALLDLPIEHYGGDLFGAAALADVRLAQGDVDRAHALLAPVPDLRGSAAAPASVIILAQGRMAAVHGDDDEAISHFTAVRTATDAARDPLRGAIVDDGAADLTRALLRAGRRDEAARILEPALAVVKRASIPGLEGIVRRNLGLARGDVAQLERSVALLERSPRTLELATSLVELGAARRRAGERTAARPHLKRALELAARAGATPLATRAREELRAAGGRPRRDMLTGPDALTTSERRVAELAAAGHTNRAIADRLFVSPKTVEGHLARTYAKLGVATRDLLAAALPDIDRQAT